jgi:hypothetical protein
MYLQFSGRRGSSYQPQRTPSKETLSQNKRKRTPQALQKQAKKEA